MYKPEMDRMLDAPKLIVMLLGGLLVLLIISAFIFA